MNNQIHQLKLLNDLAYSTFLLRVMAGQTEN